MKKVTLISQQTQQAVKKIRVAAYCRVSSSSADQLHSYSTQIRVYTELINRKPEWELVEIFADEGISGTAVHRREEFQRMIRMCEQHRIDLIITKSVSRFARNVKEALEYVRKLKLLGVAVQFEKEAINTLSLGDEMLLNTFSAMAQEESVSISQNLRFGVKKRMEDGTYINGSEPYGYRFEGKTLVPYEPEAKVVRDIFYMYLDGKSIEEIARELESKHIITSNGLAYWHHRTISIILTNEKYVGDSLYQKTYSEAIVPFTRQINRGQKDKYYAVGTHDGIITREVYEAVQKLYSEKREKFARIPATNKYPLTSRILCSECGSFYRRKIKNGIVMWVCGKHFVDKNNCNSAYCKEEHINNAFIKMINKLIFTEPNILDESLRLLEYAMALQKKGNVEALGVSQNIAELNAKLLMLEQLRGKGYLAAEVYEVQAREIKAQINQKKNERAELLESGYEKVFDELKTLKRILSIEAPLECFDEKLFESAVKEVAIDGQKKITFTLLGNLEFSEIIKD